MQVTTVIAVSIGLMLLIGCDKKEIPPFDYQLPEQVNHIEPGTASYITPEAVLDSIDRGVNLDLIYVHESVDPDPVNLLLIPGIKSLTLSEFYYAQDTLKPGQAVYLICDYGDDSRRLSYDAAKRGANARWVDGGFIRLKQALQARSK